jgi:ribose/xylose/arabinose/galactoside ABC-type transport system permease subunit
VANLRPATVGLIPDRFRWSRPVAYPLALLTETGLGMLNALLIGRVGLSPLIATLGTLTLYRGLALHLTGAALTAVSGRSSGSRALRSRASPCRWSPPR